MATLTASNEMMRPVEPVHFSGSSQSVLPQNSRKGPWLSVVSHLDPRYGGLSSAVPALGSAVSTCGPYTVALAAFCRPQEHYVPAVDSSVSIHHLPLGRLAWFRDFAARRSFQELVSSSTGVHIHGLWQMSTSTAAHAARQAAKPYLISAHGMLESWALANKKLKKQIYAALCERSNLRSAACLHALTEAEADDYRKFGLTNPVAVIPNGVNLPLHSSETAFLENFPALRGKRLILFLSRIHFKKGLDILAEAWARVSRQFPEAQLVLAGPDFENTQATVTRRLEELGVAERTTFTGMLAGELKWSALAAAECFVLPSYSEGLSVSVLEAMGMGLPVLITQQCNLPEVSEHGCGWTIPAQAGALESALTQLLSCPAAQRAEIGENGRRLVASRYSWPIIGAQMASLYSWLAGGSLPTQVNLQLPGRTR